MKFICPHCNGIISTHVAPNSVVECPQCEFPVVVNSYTGKARKVDDTGPSLNDSVGK